MEPGAFLRNSLLLRAFPSPTLPSPTVCVLLALLSAHSLLWAQPLSMDILPLLWVPGSAGPERGASTSLSLRTLPLIRIFPGLLHVYMR